MKQTTPPGSAKPRVSGFTRVSSTKRLTKSPSELADGAKISSAPRRISFADSTPTRTSVGFANDRSGAALPKAILKNKPFSNKSPEEAPGSLPERAKPRISAIFPSPAPTQSAPTSPTVPDLSFTMDGNNNGFTPSFHEPVNPLSTELNDTRTSTFFPPPSSLLSAISLPSANTTLIPNSSGQNSTPMFSASPIFASPTRERQSSHFPESPFSHHLMNPFDSTSHPNSNPALPGMPHAGLNLLWNPFSPVVNRSPAAFSYESYLLQRVQFQEGQIHMLRSQLHKCAELYSSLYAKSVENLSSTSECATQTEVTQTCDASTAMDEMTGDCPETKCDKRSTAGPLEKAVGPPINGQVSPEQQAYMEMMANIQLALKNSGNDSIIDPSKQKMPNIGDPVSGSNDVSVLCGDLAKKYLNMDMHHFINKSSRAALEQANFYGMHGSDVSFATKNYLERHGLTKSGVARNGFLRTESIIEWNEEDEAECDGSSRIQYFQQARRDAYFCRGQPFPNGYLGAQYTQGSENYDLGLHG